MTVSTPSIECQVKKSFLSGKPTFGKDETLFGVIQAIRFTRGRAPIFQVHLPELAAIYDKVDQCAIFKETPPPEEVTMEDVGWWDSISNNWELVVIEGMKHMDITAKMRTGHVAAGTYLFTCNP